MCSKLTQIFSLVSVGYVDPHLKIETVPINPYFADKEFKIILEVMFIIILAHLARTEHIEMRARRARRNAWALWTGTGTDETKRSHALKAVSEHFWSGEEPFSNVVDTAKTWLGIWIVVMWVVLVNEMGAAEDGLKHLHRPEGEVAYDDTDHDVWSDYHHEVAHVEHLIVKVMRSMVGSIRLRTLALQ